MTLTYSVSMQLSCLIDAGQETADNLLEQLNAYLLKFISSSSGKESTHGFEQYKH